jgi:hypothetical protein
MGAPIKVGMEWWLWVMGMEFGSFSNNAALADFLNDLTHRTYF